MYGLFPFGDSLIKAPCSRQIMKAIPLVGGGIIGIQFYGSSEFFVTLLEIPVVGNDKISQRCMSLGERSINLQGTPGRCFPFRVRLLWRADRIARAKFGSCSIALLKYSIAFFNASVVPVEATFPIELISLVALGAVLGKPFLLWRDFES